MSAGRSLAGLADSHPHQEDQSETVNTKPACRDPGELARRLSNALQSLPTMFSVRTVTEIS